MTKEQHIWEQLELEDYIQECVRQELKTQGYPWYAYEQYKKSEELELNE